MVSVFFLLLMSCGQISFVQRSRAINAMHVTICLICHNFVVAIKVSMRILALGQRSPAYKHQHRSKWGCFIRIENRQPSCIPSLGCAKAVLATAGGRDEAPCMNTTLNTAYFSLSARIWLLERYHKVTSCSPSGLQHAFEHLMPRAKAELPSSQAPRHSRF